MSREWCWVGLGARATGGREAPPAAYAKHTEEVDRRAVAEITAAERSLDRELAEMPHSSHGFDIRSRTPDGHWVQGFELGDFSADGVVGDWAQMWAKDGPPQVILAYPQGDLAILIRSLGIVNCRLEEVSTTAPRRLRAQPAVAGRAS